MLEITDPRSDFERFLLKSSAMTDQGADGSAVTAKAILGSPYGDEICCAPEAARSAREVQA
jgi:hypothetical protein